MDMEQFVKMSVPWSNEPCCMLSFRIFRGTMLTDVAQVGRLVQGRRPTVSCRASEQFWLVLTLSSYLGFWTPLKGKIYAALRIKRALIANRDDRIGTTSSATSSTSTKAARRSSSIAKWSSTDSWTSGAIDGKRRGKTSCLCRPRTIPSS